MTDLNHQDQIHQNQIPNPLNRNVLQLNQDPNSVYYIHSSDANTNQLVSMKFMVLALVIGRGILY